MTPDQMRQELMKMLLSEPMKTLLKELINTVESIEGGEVQVAWNDVTDKPAVIASGATQAAARTAIGAGTSDLEIGSTASTAMAGNATPTPADNSVTNAKVATGANIALSKLANVAAGTDGLAAGTLQATLQALASRIAALETP